VQHGGGALSRKLSLVLGIAFLISACGDDGGSKGSGTDSGGTGGGGGSAGADSTGGTGGTGGTGTGGSAAGGTGGTGATGGTGGGTGATGGTGGSGTGGSAGTGGEGGSPPVPTDSRPGMGLSANGNVSASANFRLVFVGGESPAGNRTMASENYQLRGGLVGGMSE
jgi:hypothetical protein